jgi:hypothetical protein
MIRGLLRVKMIGPLGQGNRVKELRDKLLKC